MQLRRATGQGAQALKYDILTALLTLAAQDSGTQGRLALRLSVLITARYNWASGQFTVGQREIARLWGVTERTAKREMAQMKSLGWITVARPAARGRVATHAIAIDTVLRATMPVWPCVGSDFEARMTGADPAPESNVIPLVPFAVSPADGSVWAQASARLQAQDPAAHAAWFRALRQVDHAAGQITLQAPSAFVARYVETHFATRLLAAISAVARDVRAVTVLAP